MKTIGLLGGMSWESTVSYYRALNEGVKAALGGLHSARVALYSVDFDEIEQLQRSGDWRAAGEHLAEAARGVEAAGADFLLICTNTMHKVAEEVAAAVSIPLLHIADATGEQLVADGMTTVGLLGTRFTMEEDFYTGRLAEKFGIEALVPDQSQRDRVHEVIFGELCVGTLSDASRSAFLGIIDALRERGAQAIVLGCTEIGLLIEPRHTDAPLYDTAAIHAARAVELALDD